METCRQPEEGGHLLTAPSRCWRRLRRGVPAPDGTFNCPLMTSHVQHVMQTNKLESRSSSLSMFLFHTKINESVAVVRFSDSPM